MIMKNPLIRSYNEPILFSELTSVHVTEATGETIRDAKNQLDALFASSDLTFNSVLGGWDRIQNTISRAFNPVYLMAETHPDEHVRQSAREAIQTFSDFLNELGIDEDFYRLIKKYSQTEEAKNLTTDRKKFLSDILLGFRRNGFELTKEKREELKDIKTEIDRLCLEFSKNIGEATGFIELTEDEISGLPADFLKERKTKDGTYKIDLTYPSYHPFMKYSNREDRRKELMMKFNNRAYPKNIAVLNQILQKRKQLAKVLGYKTYADFATEDRMVKSSATVWNFENQMIQSVKEKADRDYQELLGLKSSTTGKPETEIREWELAYWSNKLKSAKYSVDDQEVKQYFELSRTIDGLFLVTQKMLGLKYREVPNPSVWHSDVRQFEVSDHNTGKVIGSFYLDLYPRENKYGHAAMFPMVNGILLQSGEYEKPMASLVCNFPKPNRNQPSLLFFSDVKTLFHEFGHLLHGMVTTSAISLYAGTNTVIDYVETPSQFFENLVYEYDVLSLFAKHYKRDEIIPKVLVEKLISARHLGSGIQTQQQIFYGVYDFTLHDKVEHAEGEISTEILKQLKQELTQFSYADGDHFQTAFGHLAGYGAGYYSYLWSKVFAQDVWSVFEKNGVFDAETGNKFRSVILEPGGSKDALELVTEFLGREPNNTAFLKELGVS